MTFDLPWHLYLMGIIYFFAGLNHFRNTKLYLTIIPPYLPNPILLNNLCGIAEVVLGIGLCIPMFTAASAWGVIVLLIAVFPTHLYMFSNDKAGMGLPKIVLFLRMPLQIVLLLWAYYYTL